MQMLRIMVTNLSTTKCWSIKAFIRIPPGPAAFASFKAEEQQLSFTMVCFYYTRLALLSQKILSLVLRGFRTVRV